MEGSDKRQYFISDLSFWKVQVVILILQELYLVLSGSVFTKFCIRLYVEVLGQSIFIRKIIWILFLQWSYLVPISIIMVTLLTYSKGVLSPGFVHYFLLGFLRMNDDIDKFPVRMTTMLGI